VTGDRLTVPQAMERALAAYEAGRLDEAGRYCGAILDAEPDYFDARHLLAVIQSRRGLHSEALANFDRALCLKSNDPRVLNNRGNCLKELWRFSDALVSYDRALAIDGNNVELLNNRGVTLKNLGRFEEALASFDKALSISPNKADTLNNRGNVLQKLKRLDQALASYEQALASNQSHPQAFDAFAYCANKLCDWPRGARVAGQVIARAPDREFALSPFTLLGYSGDPLLRLQCARNFFVIGFPRFRSRCGPAAYGRTPKYASHISLPTFMSMRRHI
jgi:superkiller protein 3